MAVGRPRLQVNRENATLDQIEGAMDCTPAKKVFIRLQALAELYRGQSWERVVLLSRVSERQLLRWIHLFNARGIDGLIPRASSGRARKLDQHRFITEVLPVVRQPQTAQEQHWTGVKLHGWLQQQFQVELGYSTLLRYLHEQDFRLKVPRPWPEGQDQEQREKFVAELKALAADPQVELWFGDETGVEGDPRPRRRWAHKSDRIKTPYHGIHLRQSVLGAVCPRNGECAALIFNHCDSEVFQVFLDHLAQSVPPDPNKRRYLILDNASWHKVKRLNWHHFIPKYLPAYSPDLNPIERLWLGLKTQFFADFIAKTNEALIAQLIKALRHFLNSPATTAKLCSLKSSL
jgi:transposase